MLGSAKVLQRYTTAVQELSYALANAMSIKENHSWS